jgi:malonate transporter
LQQFSIGIILPLMGIMLVGYLAGYFRLLDKDSSKLLSRFVFYIAMPPFIFISLSRIPVDEFFNWPFLAVLGGGMLVVFAMSFTVARYVFPDTTTAHSLHALTAMFSSTAYLGLPIILVVFGEAGLVPGIIGSVITGAVFMPLAIVIIEIDKGLANRKLLSTLLMSVIQNPLLLATAAGLLASASNISVPLGVTSFCELLGDAFIPCALFAAGLFISGCSVKGELKEISWLVLVKLFLHPLITWWLAFHVFQLNHTLAMIAVLQAALPSGVPVFVLAQHYGSFVTRSNAVIVLSTGISILSLSAFFLLFF